MAFSIVGALLSGVAATPDDDDEEGGRRCRMTHLSPYGAHHGAMTSPRDETANQWHRRDCRKLLGHEMMELWWRG
jgi:hypothetical protein